MCSYKPIDKLSHVDHHLHNYPFPGGFFPLNRIEISYRYEPNDIVKIVQHYLPQSNYNRQYYLAQILYFLAW